MAIRNPIRRAAAAVPAHDRVSGEGPAPVAASLPEAGRCLALGALALVAALLAAPLDGLVGAPLGLALALYGAVAILVLRGLTHHRLPRFGIANAVTVLRAAIACGLLAIAWRAGAISPELRGAVTALGALFLVLDGVDGGLARRFGLISAFGARFDMEVDAFFIVAITLLLLRSGQAPAWVLAIGAARYIFVALGWLCPPLARELPERRRRKIICGLVVVVLLVALAPGIDPAAAGLLCGGALVLLVYSFAADYLWLVRMWRTAPESL